VGWKGIFLATFFCLSVTSVNALGVCEGLILNLKNRRDLQPRTLELKSGERVLFHNRRLFTLFARGLSAKAVDAAEKLLTRQGALQIKISDEGYVVAADSRGTYSEAIWARDSARVASGLEGAERAKVVGKLLEVMANPLNRELYFLNIRNPNVHQMHDDELQAYLPRHWSPLFEGLPVTTTMFVPHIRFLLAQFKDPQVKPERWNMKQNDALALVLIEGLRALEDGVLRWEELSAEQKSYFSLTVAYGIRTHFWETWDSGAWEEANARRTSSVGLFTEALIRLQRSPYLEKIVTSITADHKFPPDIREKLESAFQTANIQSAIDSGMRIVRLQIERGEAPDRFDGGAPQSQRFSDAALAHLMWYRPAWLTEADYLRVIDHLEKLTRASGIIRYEGDVYLTLGQSLPSDDPIPAEILKDGEKSGPIKAADLQAAFWRKDEAYVASLFGQRYETQWVLADMMLVQILPFLMETFPDSAHQARYETLLQESALRMFGFVTGGVGDAGPYALDGLQVSSWRFPEAWIPVRLYRTDGSIETVWTLSKFTPLNWATAEARLALKSLRDYLARKPSVGH